MAELSEEQKRIQKEADGAVRNLVTIYKRLDGYLTTLKRHRDNPNPGLWPEHRTDIRNFLYNSAKDFDDIRSSLT